MKNIFVSILLCLFSISPAFASGDHDEPHGHGMKSEGHGHGEVKKEGHGHGEMKSESHGHGDMKKEGHGHGEMKEGHGHGEGGHKETVGKPAKPEEATRTIPVILNDQMKIIFKESLTEIKAGSIIQFTVANEGKIPHEFSIGNQEEQKEHAEMMRKMPSMVHADGNTVTVGPGKTKTLTWRFEGDDTVVFACNIPGHYEAGMFKNVDLK